MDDRMSYHTSMNYIIKICSGEISIWGLKLLGKKCNYVISDQWRLTGAAHQHVTFFPLTLEVNTFFGLQQQTLLLSEDSELQFLRMQFVITYQNTNTYTYWGFFIFHSDSNLMWLKSYSDERLCIYYLKLTIKRWWVKLEKCNKY